MLFRSTQIKASINLDGTGKARFDIGVPFLEQALKISLARPFQASFNTQPINRPVLPLGKKPPWLHRLLIDACGPPVPLNNR